MIAISALKDITGQRFGKLKVLGYDHSEKCKDGKSTRTYWLCKCSCGNTKVVSKNCLRSGHTESCGKCACTYDLDSYEYGVCTTRIGRQFIFDKNDYEKIKDVTWYFHHDYVVGRKPGTYADNMKNQALHKDNTSGYAGVCPNLGWGKPWTAQFIADGVTHYLGHFDTKEEAAEAISIERKKIVGDFVRAPFDMLNGTRRY